MAGGGNSNSIEGRANDMVFALYKDPRRSYLFGSAALLAYIAFLRVLEGFSLNVAQAVAVPFLLSPNVLFPPYIPNQ
jgi:hypothetical protein